MIPKEKRARLYKDMVRVYVSAMSWVLAYNEAEEANEGYPPSLEIQQALDKLKKSISKVDSKTLAEPEMEHICAIHDEFQAAYNRLVVIPTPYASGGLVHTLERFNIYASEGGFDRNLLKKSANSPEEKKLIDDLIEDDF